MAERVLTTAIERLELRTLAAQHAAVYFDLVQRSRELLMQFGNYEVLLGSSRVEIEAAFAIPAAPHVRMGLWCGDDLAGRVDLTHAKPGTFVLGYWLGAEYQKRGFATAACRELIAHGRAAHGATDYWSGVTHGNERSIAVLERLGFARVERLENHTRFHLPA